MYSNEDDIIDDLRAQLGMLEDENSELHEEILQLRIDSENHGYAASEAERLEALNEQLECDLNDSEKENERLRAVIERLQATEADLLNDTWKAFETKEDLEHRIEKAEDFLKLYLNAHYLAESFEFDYPQISDLYRVADILNGLERVFVATPELRT